MLSDIERFEPNWGFALRGLVVVTITFVAFRLAERYVRWFRRIMERKRAEQVDREMTLPSSWGADASIGNPRARALADLRPAELGGGPKLYARRPRLR